MKRWINNQKKERLLILLPLLILAGSLLYSQEPEQYKISVDAVLVPAFAVDQQGNPVFGLKKEDFELAVNGKPTEIAELLAVPFYRYESGSTTGKKSSNIISPVPCEEAPVERFIFLILDNVFISHAGYRRAKSIAAGIIKNSPPGDIFVVLENTHAGGLRYVGGIEKGRKSLIGKINALSVPESAWSKNLFSTRQWNLYADTNPNDPREALGGEMVRLKNLKKAFERKSYQQQVLNFAKSMKPLKYALRSVIKPKIVYLISEGIAKSAYLAGLAHADSTGVAILNDERTVKDINYVYNSIYFRHLKEMVNAFNDGGSVLYTINPGKPKADEGSSGDTSLHYMAAEGGGKYFSGTKTKDIISNIQRSTAAYYELAFMINQDSSKKSNKLKIKIKCKKDGVIVHSFDRTERGKAYHEMSKIEKQLFGFNVAIGGNWSRMVGKVIRIRYKKREKGDAMNISVKLPEEMRNKPLDIFTISYDPTTNKTVVNMTNQTVTTERMDIVFHNQPAGTLRNYFVVIEPENVYCIYDEIR